MGSDKGAGPLVNLREASHDPTFVTLLAICGTVVLLDTATERLPVFNSLPHPRLALYGILVFTLSLYSIWLIFWSSFVFSYKPQSIGLSLAICSIAVVLGHAAAALAVTEHLSNPALLLLGVLVVVIGLHNIGLGGSEAFRTKRNRFSRDSDPVSRRHFIWPHLFVRSQYTQLGVAILGTFLGVGIYIATNAGLILLGP